MKALLIPVEGPITELVLPEEGALDVMQEAVGGDIQYLPLPHTIVDGEFASVYFNEAGKMLRLPYNERATRFMQPGVGIFDHDVIVGPMIVVGLDPHTGSDADLPESIVQLLAPVSVAT